MARANHDSHRTKRRKTGKTDALKTETSSDDDTQSSCSREESKPTKAMQQIEAHINDIKHGQAYIKLKLHPVLTADLERVGSLDLSKECRILVIGQTGAGKSRSITALLDEDRLLPTGGNGQACTAAPIEVHYNDNDDWAYIAEYKYMTCAELREDFDIVQSAFSDDGVDKEADAGPITRFKTLYPDLTDHQLKTITFEDVLASNEVREKLGESPRKRYNNKAQFYAELSQTAATTTNGSSTWALLDMVRLYVKHPLLENGLVLVDVPGVGDDNATRNERATKYIQDCSAVCIMAECIRATSNSTFRGLIKRALRQVQFSDRLACTVLVCTKADDVDLKEVNLSLNPDGVEELTTQIHEAKEYRKELRARTEVERTKLEIKTATAGQCARDTPRWKTKRTRALKNGKTMIDPPKPPLYSTPMMSQKTNEYYNTDDIDVVLEQIQHAKKELDTEVQKLQKLLPDLEAEARGLDTDVKRMTFEWNRRTVRTRAEHIRLHQRAAYIKEVQAHDAEALKAAHDVSAEFASQSSVNHDYATMQSQVPVFVISAKAYQGHLGFSEGKTAMEVFESKNDTEIPALQSHLSSIAMAARSDHLTNVHLKVDTILATLAQTLKESTETQAGDLVDAKIAIDEFLTILSEKPAAFEHCATVALRSIRSAYKSQFTDMMARIQGNIIQKALAGMSRFAATPDKSIPAKTKGLYYPEYKAAVRKKGQHNGSRVAINFNRTVADAFRYSIETLLKRLFTTENKSAGAAERSAKDRLNKCHDEMKDVFNELHTDFKVRAVEAHLPQYTITSLERQLVRRKRELEAMMEALKGKIGKVYGDASVPLMTDVMRAWNETYLRAAAVKGTGARDDLIEILGKSVENGDVVSDVLERLSEKMRQQTDEVMLEFKGEVGLMARSMVVDYEQAVRTGREWEESVGDSDAIEDCRRALPALDCGDGGGENGEVMVKVEMEAESE
ncbi:hypothetical protein LTR70_000306 [Exophiala xenobiotica]|uniref:Dynamin N-terminal domain-containing protein n=1 Tax=Lithohypha guttulata TaxID=1690604 RepID=A0ABR0KR40_9EURO|nr:hypothetical protein LTR24_000009 [Lithohypha guttulata]KAK5330476.1 hypothetical protein LTR70_000306 [Exophiala xenobiotica]